MKKIVRDRILCTKSSEKIFSIKVIRPVDRVHRQLYFGVTAVSLCQEGFKTSEITKLTLILVV